MKKKLLIIIAALILCVTGCATTSVSNSSNSNSNGDTTSIKFTEDKITGVFQFTNASLVSEDNKWVFDATVTNTSDEIQKISYFVIKLYNEEDLVSKTRVVSAPILEAHNATSVHVTYNEDLTNVTRVEYEIER